jgi:hypothetical protein
MLQRGTQQPSSNLRKKRRFFVLGGPREARGNEEGHFQKNLPQDNKLAGNGPEHGVRLTKSGGKNGADRKNNKYHCSRYLGIP